MTELGLCPVWIAVHVEDMSLGDDSWFVNQMSDIREAAAVKSVLAGISDEEAWLRAYTGWCQKNGLAPVRRPA
jgi:hypothetical protein